MKKLALSLVLLSLTSLLASDNSGLTNEQKIKKSLASVQGSNFRHTGYSIEECNKFKTELEFNACINSYKKVDEMLKSR